MSVASVRHRRPGRRAAAVVIAGLAIAGVAMLASRASSNGTGRYQPSGPSLPIVQPPADVPLTAAARRGINRTLDAFIPAAVARHHPGRAYRLTTGSFRGDTTRAGWAKGSLPVLPYPAVGRRFHGWRVDFSNAGSVGIDLELHPADQAKVGLVAFSIVLQRQGGRWLIDAFAPVASFQPSGTGANIQAAPDFSPAARGSGNDDRPIDQKWILLPLAVLTAPIVALLGFGLFGVWRWRRDRPAPAEALDDYYSSMNRVGEATRRGPPPAPDPP
jgi:hypothetical protein